MNLRSRGRLVAAYLQLSAVSAMALGLTGCIVGPDYETPGLVMPAGFSGTKHDKSAAARPQLTEWWRQMNDPMLNQLIERAVASNLDVASAKARIREARAAYRQTTGDLLPSLDGSTSATRNKSASSGQTDIYSQYKGGFDASWELDLFGANRRAREAARYSEQAAEEDLKDTYVSLIGDVASYYVTARKYQALVALATQTARSQANTAQLTAKRQQGGDATGVDTATANGQAASTEADIPTYRIYYVEAVNRLGVLLGQAPSQIQASMDKQGKIPSPKRAPRLGIPADVLSSRPDIRLAERQLAQYTAKIGQAEAARYPSVSLTGDIATTASSLSDLGRTSTISWSFGPSVSIPIFQGGKLKAAVDVAKAQRDQYFIAYQSAVLSAVEDVENAVVALNQSQIRRAKLSVSVDAYRKATRLSHELNSEGATSLLDVLETERSLYSVEEDLIDSQADIATYYIALHKALGGGWSGDPRIETPAVVDSRTAPRIAHR